MASVQSVNRAFHILEVLSTGELGLTEIAARTNLPKSTVARIAGTLEELGAVERVGDDGGYRIGAEIVALAGVASPTANLVSLARPHLRLLADQTGEDAGFSVPDGYRVHYIDQMSSDNDIQVRDWTGARIPMHAVPSGLVILATWPTERLDRFLERDLQSFTDATVTDPDAIRKRLLDIERDGFAWLEEEFTEGLSSVAAPVRDGRHKVVGSIHIHGPSFRFPPSGSRRDIGELLLDTARRLGGHVPRM